MLVSQIQKILSNHQQELYGKFGVITISIFGSYARNEEKPESDIDIAVEMEKADLFIMSSLKNYLQELLGKNVDIIRIRKNMNSFLKCRIKRDSINV